MFNLFRIKFRNISVRGGIYHHSEFYAKKTALNKSLLVFSPRLILRFYVPIKTHGYLSRVCVCVCVSLKKLQ